MHSLPWLWLGVCVSWVLWLQESALVSLWGWCGGMWCSPCWAVGLAGDLSIRAAASLVQPWELSLSQQRGLGCSSSLQCLPRDMDVVSIASLRVFALGNVSYRHFRELVSPSLG